MELIKNFRYNDLVLYCKGWYEGSDNIFADFERYIRMNEGYYYPKTVMKRCEIITHALKAVDLIFTNFTKEKRENHYLGTMAKFYDYTNHRMWLYNCDFETAILWVIHEFLQGLEKNQIELIPPTYEKGKPRIGWIDKQGMTYKQMNNEVKRVFKL